MNRLDTHLAHLKRNDEKALILFLTAGDPDLAATLQIMYLLAANGVDCIELGVPFSDPVADGPVIQESTKRALAHNIHLRKILELVRKFRQSYDTPVVLMGYFNPVYRYGLNDFVKDFKNAGGDGLIIADLPFEEGEELESICCQNGVCLIYLLAPEIGSARTEQIVAASRGFVYCVSHYGTTGIGANMNATLAEVLASLKPLTDLPLMIGFGISSIADAQAAAAIADGVIIGSWFIKELSNAKDKAKRAGEFATAVKTAISQVNGE